MAVDLTLSAIGGGYDRTNFNNNFDLIVAALDDALSRSGNGPNQMTADLDLNGYDLLNAGNVLTSGSSPVTSVFGRTGTVTATSGDYDTDEVTEGTNKYVSAAQKTKLDGIESSANNYSHPNHSGDVTSSGDGATTIANSAVSNPKMANMPEDSIKGRIGSAGAPQDLTPLSVRTIIESLPMEVVTQAEYDGGSKTAGRLYFING